MRHAVLIGAENTVQAASSDFAQSFGFSNISQLDATELIHPDQAGALLQVFDAVRVDKRTRNVPLVNIWHAGRWKKAKLVLSVQQNFVRIDIDIVEQDLRAAQTPRPVSEDNPTIPADEVVEMRRATRKELAGLCAHGDADTATLEMRSDGTVTYCVGDWSHLGVDITQHPPTLNQLAKLMGEHHICTALSEQLAKAFRGMQTVPVEFAYDAQRWNVLTTAIACSHTVGKYNVLLALAPVEELEPKANTELDADSASRQAPELDTALPAG